MREDTKREKHDISRDAKKEIFDLRIFFDLDDDLMH